MINLYILCIAVNIHGLFRDIGEWADRIVIASSFSFGYLFNQTLLECEFPWIQTDFHGRLKTHENSIPSVRIRVPMMIVE